MSRELKFVFPIGLPASGKSTWVNQQRYDDAWYRDAVPYIFSYDKYRRVEPFRSMEDIDKREKAVKKQLLADIQDVIENEEYSRVNVYIDNTNLSEKSVARITDFIDDQMKGRDDAYTFHFEDSFLDESVETCVIRDAEREESVQVGPKVIYRMHNQHVTRRRRRKIDALRKEYSAFFGDAIERDEVDTHTIVVDIDGTLALMGKRSPYDASKYYEDLVNYPVLQVVVNWLRGRGKGLDGSSARVVFLSGREGTETGRDYTLKWLQSFILPTLQQASGWFQWELLMREEGDYRPDGEVKSEIFTNNNIGDGEEDLLHFILDDRDQVVEMWRHKGLPCFQVSNGDF